MTAQQSIQLDQLDDHYLAFKVRAALRKHKVSQARVATHLGRGKQYVYRRLRAEVPFSAVELAQISALLGLSSDHFLGGPP